MQLFEPSFPSNPHITTLDYELRKKMVEDVFKQQTDQINQIITECLNRLGYYFEHDEQIKDFIKKYGKLERHVDINVEILYIKKIPILEIQYDPKFDFVTDGFAMKIDSSVGHYIILVEKSKAGH